MNKKQHIKIITEYIQSCVPSSLERKAKLIRSVDVSKLNSYTVEQLEGIEKALENIIWNQLDVNKLCNYGVSGVVKHED